MSNSDLVSVIVNCQNGQDYLKKSIYSILNQTYKNIEIIFFDNCSKDQSAVIVENIDTNKIKIYKSDVPLKLYKARNIAVSKCTGNYITFLDVDDWWEKTKIEKQVNKIKEECSDIVYTNFWIVNNKKKIYSSKKLPVTNLDIEFLKKYPINISSVMMKSYIFKKKKKYFDDIYEIIGDFDLMYKLSHEFKFSVIQEPLVNYLDHSNNTSKLKLHLRTLQ